MEGGADMDMDVDMPNNNLGNAPMEGANDDGLFMSCTNCNKKFDDFEYDKIHFLETCCHIVCKVCFLKIVEQQYGEKQRAD